MSQLTGPAPSATNPSAGTAHIAWSAVTLSPAVPTVDVEVVFTVERKPSGGSTWVFVCGTDATPKPYNVLSCDDTPPAIGVYDYRVTARLRTWTSGGVASVTVAGDTTAPASTIAFPSAAVYSAASWNAGCTSSLCGTASDTGGSGLQKVEISVRQGSGNYWNGSAFASASEVWNLASGTSSWMYGFGASSFPADGAYTVSSRATDNALNVQSPVTTQSFTLDTTAPSLTAAAIAATTGSSPAGFVRQSGGYAVYADASDANGVTSVTADVSSVTTGQTSVSLASCSSSCTVGGHTYLYKSAALTASNPLSEGSKSFSVGASDVVSNASSPASFSVVVDDTGPSVSAVVAATTGTSPQGFVTQGGTYRVFANVTDLPAGAGAASGVDASSITANVANVTTGQTAVALGACGACGPGSAYAYQSAQLVASSPLPEGSKPYSVSGGDKVGTSGTSSGATVQIDNTAPSVAIVLANTATGEGGWLAQGGALSRVRERHRPSVGVGRRERRRCILDHRRRLHDHDRPDRRRAHEHRLPVPDQRHELRVPVGSAHRYQPARRRSEELHGQRAGQPRVDDEPERERHGRQQRADALDPADVRHGRRRQGRSGQGDLRRDARRLRRRDRALDARRTLPAALRTRSRASRWPRPSRH